MKLFLFKTGLARAGARALNLFEKGRLGTAWNMSFADRAARSYRASWERGGARRVQTSSGSGGTGDSSTAAGSCGRCE